MVDVTPVSHTGAMARTRLDRATVKVKVTCAQCGRDYIATPQPDGSMAPIPGTGACDDGAPVTPHYTARQLRQIERLGDENPDAAY
jgi:hypothetical protein